MSIGTWQPAEATPLDAGWLRALAARCSAGIEGEADVRRAIDAADIGARAGLMRRDAADWEQAAAAFTDSELVNLVRFFTLAEAALPGWEAAARSPVVPLARILRARGAWPPALTRWIREHSDNRYLPYGSINGR